LLDDLKEGEGLESGCVAVELRLEVSLPLRDFLYQISRPEAFKDQCLLEIREKALEIARREAPVRTGRLRDSIVAQKLEDRVEVISTAPYSAVVHRGARPHRIPKTGLKFMIFEKEGRIVKARVVHHPGTKPNPFLIRAAKRIIFEAVKLILRRAERIGWKL